MASSRENTLYLFVGRGVSTPDLTLKRPYAKSSEQVVTIVAIHLARSVPSHKSETAVTVLHSHVVMLDL